MLDDEMVARDLSVGDGCERKNGRFWKATLDGKQ
jgi:hypothetical protein